jgi:hypothetical protein
MPVRQDPRRGACRWPGRRGPIPAAALAAVAVLAASCGSDPGTADASPIVGLSAGAWTWVDFPDSACDDGSPTGIAVSPGTGSDLVVFLNGGGACWDYLTCVVLGTAAGGPFGRAQFEDLAARGLPGSILDRTLAGNPFRDATLVFVPYCTGDIHGGNQVASYQGPGGSFRIHHVGHANLEAFARRVAATWPSPRKLVVAGASAGGFGALVNYDTLRRRFPSSQGYLVDDSGPPLEPGAVSQTLLDAWFRSWRLGDVLDPLCGSPCRAGLSPGLAAVAARYPKDRLALLSSLQDSVISGYLLLDGDRFQQELLRLSARVAASLPNARTFLVGGSGHTMLGSPAGVAQGVSLLEWIAQQVSDDPAWSSQQP